MNSECCAGHSRCVAACVQLQCAHQHFWGARATHQQDTVVLFCLSQVTHAACSCPPEYRLVAKKGEGTFSEVLKAQCIKNGKYVAIKCMKNHFDSLDQVRAAGCCMLHVTHASSVLGLAQARCTGSRHCPTPAVPHTGHGAQAPAVAGLPLPGPLRDISPAQASNSSACT